MTIGMVLHWPCITNSMEYLHRVSRVKICERIDEPPFVHLWHPKVYVDLLGCIEWTVTKHVLVSMKIVLVACSDFDCDQEICWWLAVGSWHVPWQHQEDRRRHTEYIEESERVDGNQRVGHGFGTSSSLGPCSR